MPDDQTLRQRAIELDPDAFAAQGTTMCTALSYRRILAIDLARAERRLAEAKARDADKPGLRRWLADRKGPATDA